MPTTQTAIIEVPALGQVFRLVAQLRGKEGLLFALDIKEQRPPAQRFDTMPKAEQEEIKNNFEVDPELEKKLDDFQPPPSARNGSSWKETLIDLFHMVHFNNVAFFWDRVNSETFLLLDICIELGDVLASKDGNLALEYISLDFVRSSKDHAPAELEEKASTIRKKTAVATNEILGQGKLHQLLDEASGKADAMRKKMSQMLAGFNKIQEQIEAAEKSFNTGSQILKNAGKRFLEGPKLLEEVSDYMYQQQEQINALQAARARIDELIEKEKTFSDHPPDNIDNAPDNLSWEELEAYIQKKWKEVQP